MPYDKQNILTSERPYQVFSEIVKAGEEGSYATEIGQQIESNQQNVSEIIKVLKEVDLIQKGKRTRAQYYVLDQEGLVNIFLAQWESKVQEETLEYQVLEELVEEIVIPQEKLKLFLSFYVQSYCSNQETSNIRKMLIEDFFKDLDRVITLKDEQDILSGVDVDLPEDEVPEWLEKMYAILEFINQPQSLSHNISTALTAYHNAWEEVEEENEESGASE
ncbi:MAG: winged helix-turn-helix domain-containing protein [Candidatus Nanohalobium sp.]